MMRRIHDLPAVPPLVIAFVLIIAVAAHAGAWYFISHHLAVSGVVASALIALAIIKHVGWIGGGFVLFKRRRALHE